MHFAKKREPRLKWSQKRIKKTETNETKQHKKRIVYLCIVGWTLNKLNTHI